MEITDKKTGTDQAHNVNKSIFKKYIVLIVLAFLLFGSFQWGYTQGKNSTTSSGQIYPITNTSIQNKLPQGEDRNIDFSLFWKVWDLLKEKYVNKNSLDTQTLIYGAIKGMLKATGDPYSNFFNPKETQDFAQEISGNFDGIGAELGIKDDILTVIAPLDNSPAQKAGLLAGDKILKIEDKSTSDMTIDQAVDLVRGEKGTTVKLTIFHKGAQETKDISIVRDTIQVKSVKLDFKDNNVAYLKINKFSEDTSKEFDLAMNTIISKNSKGIILDLRNNPGGFLDQSVDVASRLIPRGKPVVIEEDSTGKKDTLNTAGGDKLSNLPMVILINEGSASASEILAGALKDDRNITLIGKKSFGKGSVQELISLPQGSSAKITVAKWLTPNGDYIMEKGISPDIDIDLTLDDFNNSRDPQLDKAAEVMQQLIK